MWHPLISTLELDLVRLVAISLHRCPLKYGAGEFANL